MSSPIAGLPVLSRDLGMEANLLWLRTRKLQRKVLILYDMLGKFGYMMKIHSITDCLFGWEGHKSG